MITYIVLTLMASVVMSSTFTAQLILAKEPTFWEKILRIFRTPLRIGSGTNRQAAAVQDRCPFIPENSPRLTALVPAMKTGETYSIEKTVSLRPDFWVYVPYTTQQYRDAEFVLIDQQEEDVHRAKFPLVNSEPAILRLQLPDTVEIKPGERYQWVFSILCNPANRSGDATVHGWVEQAPVSEKLAAALSQIDQSQNVESYVLEKALAYANAEVWFETLSTLAAAYQQSPDNRELQMVWAQFLEEMSLDKLIDVPVMSCCKTSE